MDGKNIPCPECGGTGIIELEEIDTTPTMYGKHEIGNDWSKIENVYIWFQALNHDKKPNKKHGWNGVRGYVYETSLGEYVAPFRGELIKVVKDTKDEFREPAKQTKQESNER